MSKLLLLSFGLSCAWFCLPGRLCAQPDAAGLEAAAVDAAASEYEDAIRRAIEEFDAGHWEEARALFRRAHDISPNARTWRGLGITAFELRRYVDAVSELEAALSSTFKPLTDKQRAEIEGLLARARGFVSTYRIVVTPRDATLQVDGQPAALRGGELLLDPGAHTLLLRAAGYQDRHAELRAEAGQREQISIELQLDPPRPAEVAPVAVAAPRERQVPARYVYTWSFAGAAIGVAIPAVVVGAYARDKNDKWKACTKREIDSECSSLEEDGKRQQRTTNALAGVAGSLAIAAVVAYFLERPAHRPRRAVLLLQPRSVGLVSSFEF